MEHDVNNLSELQVKLLTITLIASSMIRILIRKYVNVGNDETDKILSRDKGTALSEMFKFNEKHHNELKELLNEQNQSIFYDSVQGKTLRHKIDLKKLDIQLNLDLLTKISFFPTSNKTHHLHKSLNVIKALMFILKDRSFLEDFEGKDWPMYYIENIIGSKVTIDNMVDVFCQCLKNISQAVYNVNTELSWHQNVEKMIQQAKVSTKETLLHNYLQEIKNQLNELIIRNRNSKDNEQTDVRFETKDTGNGIETFKKDANSSLKQDMIVTFPYVILLGDIGAGKSTLVEKLTGKTGRSSAAYYSETKFSEAFFSFDGSLLISDTPGTNPLNEQLEHQIWIADAMNSYTVSRILIVVKADTRIDRVIYKVKEYSEGFVDFFKMLGVCVTHMDTIRWDKEKFKRLLKQELCIEIAVFSGNKTDPLKLLSDIKETCTMRQRVEITDKKFKKYFKISNNNFKILKLVKNELSEMEIIKQQFYKQLKHYPENDKVDLIYEFLSWITEEIKEAGNRVSAECNFTFNGLNKDLETGYIVDMKNQLKHVLRDVRIQAHSYRTNFADSNMRKCPHCGKLWPKLKVFDGKISCGIPIDTYCGRKEIFATFTFKRNQEILTIEKTIKKEFNSTCKSEEMSTGCGKELNWTFMAPNISASQIYGSRNESRANGMLMEMRKANKNERIEKVHTKSEPLKTKEPVHKGITMEDLSELQVKLLTISYFTSYLLRKLLASFLQNHVNVGNIQTHNVLLEDEGTALSEMFKFNEKHHNELKELLNEQNKYIFYDSVQDKTLRKKIDLKKLDIQLNLDLLTKISFFPTSNKTHPLHKSLNVIKALMFILKDCILLEESLAKTGSITYFHKIIPQVTDRNLTNVCNEAENISKALLLNTKFLCFDERRYHSVNVRFKKVQSSPKENILKQYSQHIRQQLNEYINHQETNERIENVQLETKETEIEFGIGDKSRTNNPSFGYANEQKESIKKHSKNAMETRAYKATTIKENVNNLSELQLKLLIISSIALSLIRRLLASFLIRKSVVLGNNNDEINLSNDEGEALSQLMRHHKTYFSEINDFLYDSSTKSIFYDVPSKKLKHKIDLKKINIQLNLDLLKNISFFPTSNKTHHLHKSLNVIEALMFLLKDRIIWEDLEGITGQMKYFDKSIPPVTKTNLVEVCCQEADKISKALFTDGTFQQTWYETVHLQIEHVKISAKETLLHDYLAEIVRELNKQQDDEANEQRRSKREQTENAQLEKEETEREINEYSNEKQCRMAVLPYVVLLGDVGAGKSTLIEKLTGIKRRSTYSHQGTTKSFEEFFVSDKSFLICDTPGSNLIDNLFEYNRWIADAMNSHPVSNILIVVKADTRIDQVIDGIKTYATRFIDFYELLCVCITHMDTIHWDKEKFKHILRRELCMEIAIFSGKMTCHTKLLCDIKKACNMTHNVEITDNNVMKNIAMFPSILEDSKNKVGSKMQTNMKD